jgi:hypothetical protein
MHIGDRTIFYVKHYFRKKTFCIQYITQNQTNPSYHRGQMCYINHNHNQSSLYIHMYFNVNNCLFQFLFLNQSL